MSDTPEIVYHYTNHIAFMKILESKQLWAHDARLSNDRRETDYALGLMTLAIESVSKEKGFKEHIGRIRELIDDPFNPFRLRDVHSYLLIASLSEEPNLLSQWRAYAPENGYAIGLNLGMLRSITESVGFKCSNVRYNFSKSVEYLTRQLRGYLRRCERETLVDDSIDACLARFTELLGSIVPLVKHSSFEEEKEWRIFRACDDAEKISFYAGRRSIVPYRPIPLAGENLIDALEEVVIGPADDHHTLANWTAQYLCTLGYEVRRNPEGRGVRVSVSGSPYRANR